MLRGELCSVRVLLCVACVFTQGMEASHPKVQEDQDNQYLHEDSQDHSTHEKEPASDNNVEHLEQKPVNSSIKEKHTSSDTTIDYDQDYDNDHHHNHNDSLHDNSQEHLTHEKKPVQDHDHNHDHDHHHKEEEEYDTEPVSYYQMSLTSWLEDLLSTDQTGPINDDHTDYFHDENTIKLQHDHTRHDQHQHNDNDDDHHELPALSLKTWLVSLCSIAVISLVGLATVAAVPLLQGRHRDSLLSLLVSLAIGTLLGDALMHLLPHSLNNPHPHAESGPVWRGFLATCTLIGLATLEQGMSLFGHGHSHGQGRQPLHNEKELRVKPSSLKCKQGHDLDEDTLEEMTYLCKEGHQLDRGTLEEMTSLSTPPPEYSSSCPSIHTLESGESLAKPHHPMPSSARMVILGDAFHNFADGLAIGAAFSLSLPAGLSTSIAVLCHELPHEIGDFALLLQSGVSVKTAVLANIISSIAAFAGLVAGLLLGSAGPGSSWLLTATVGVFLYVALASMLPEILATSLAGLLTNTVGMLGGAVLLLFIGLYEHQLEEWLEGGDGH